MLSGEQIWDECGVCKKSGILQFTISNGQMGCGLVNILCYDTQSFLQKNRDRPKLLPIVLCLEAILSH